MYARLMELFVYEFSTKQDEKWPMAEITCSDELVEEYKNTIIKLKIMGEEISKTAKCKIRW